MTDRIIDVSMGPCGARSGVFHKTIYNDLGEALVHQIADIRIKAAAGVLELGYKVLFHLTLDNRDRAVARLTFRGANGANPITEFTYEPGFCGPADAGDPGTTDAFNRAIAHASQSKIQSVNVKHSAHGWREIDFAINAIEAASRSQLEKWIDQDASTGFAKLCSWELASRDRSGT